MSQVPAEPPPHHEEEDLSKMSFGDHLDELRKRLVRSLVAIAVCVFGMLPFKQEVTTIYVQPYRLMWREAFATHADGLEAKAAAAGGIDKVHELERESIEFCRKYRASILDGTFPDDQAFKIKSIGSFKASYHLVATGGLEDMWTFIAASFLFALIIASPIVLYQMWAFIGAGLYKRERKVVMRYLPFGIALGSLGVAFGYFVVVPTAFYFLVQLMYGVEFLPSVSQYFSLLFTLTAALALVFQLPLLMLALTKVGIVSHAAWKKNWRYVILAFFVLSALLTPPDPFTQMMMALPLIVLYCVGLFFTSRANPALRAYETVDGDG